MLLSHSLYLLLLLLLLFEHLLWTHFLVLYFIFACFGWLLILLRRRILRRLSLKWTFKCFLRLRKIVKWYAFFTLLSVLVVSVVLVMWLVPTAIVGEFSPAIFALPFGLYTIFCVIEPLTNVFGTASEASLYLQQFIEEYDEEPENANFKMVLFASRKISEWVRSMNLVVSPNLLALGISSLILADENREPINDLITSLDNPFESDFHKKFLKSVKTFTSFAQQLKETGVHEPSRLSSEMILRLLRYVIIPLTVAFLAHVLPKIIGMLAQS